MSFKAGEEIVASLNKNSPKVACAGVVIKMEPGACRAQIALKHPGLILKHGLLVHIESCEDPELCAWGSVQRVTLAGDVKIVDLVSLRHEDEVKPRAARYPIELKISAKVPTGETFCSTTRGFSIDLSLSGLKARFQDPVPENVRVQILLHLNENKVVEAVARVVRREDESGMDCVVALEFQRFVRGYENLIEMLPNERAA